MKDSQELRQKIIDGCLLLRDYGYIFGTWGNFSVRLDDGKYLLTPSKVDYSEMRPDDLVVINKDGIKIDGNHFPTSEREIHRMILNKRQDMNVVIHTHSPYAMACSALEEGIPALSEEMCQILGGDIPLSYRFVPSDMHEELGVVVSNSIGKANAVLIRNHGPVVLGRTIEEALVSCQVVEKSAQIYISLLSTNKKINFLSREIAERGRDYFVNKYGKS